MSELPISSGGGVPVFDCHVLVAPPDERGVVRARCASLPDVTGQGGTERDALAAVARAFKAVVAKHHAEGTTVPFVEPEPPAEGETERWLPVHL